MFGSPILKTSSGFVIKQFDIKTDIKGPVIFFIFIDNLKLVQYMSMIETLPGKLA